METLEVFAPRTQQGVGKLLSRTSSSASSLAALVAPAKPSQAPPSYSSSERAGAEVPVVRE